MRTRQQLQGFNMRRTDLNKTLILAIGWLMVGITFVAVFVSFFMRGPAEFWLPTGTGLIAAAVVIGLYFLDQRLGTRR